MAKAAARVPGVDTFRAAIPTEAVRALVVVGLLSEADAVEAIEVVRDAELITVDAFQQATDAAEAPSPQYLSNTTLVARPIQADHEWLTRARSHEWLMRARSHEGQAGGSFRGFVPPQAIRVRLHSWLRGPIRGRPEP